MTLQMCVRETCYEAEEGQRKRMTEDFNDSG